MIPISIDKFINDYMKSNKGENEQQLRRSLHDAVKRKKDGATCTICGQPIRGNR